MALMEMNLTGRPVDRIDGAAKVTGAATYAAEFRPEHMLYAVAINARVPKGTLRAVDDAAARAVPGVIEVITPFNAPKLSRATVSPYTDEDALHGITDLSPPNYVLQNREVIHYGQEIGVIVAETFEAARLAATLVRFEYEAESAKLGLESHRDEAFTPQQLLIPVPPEYERGDVAKGLAEADVTLDATYETPVEQHCAMEPNAALAEWRGDRVVIHTSTQNVFSVQKTVANSFSVPLERVQVICPYVGGGFGSKVGTWGHVHLAVMAAKVVDRPVKLLLSRQQAFFTQGHRPHQTQRFRLGATRDGRFTAIDQEIHVQTDMARCFVEHTGETTARLYACENVGVRHRGVRTNIPAPTIMRAPGSAPGMFAFESAIDELADKLEIDPIDLRLINDTGSKDPETGNPWSTKGLRACFEEGRRRFGWERRTPQPRSMRDGRFLVGYGVATATYPAWRVKSAARLTLRQDGSLLVETAATDIGTGTYTILAQIAADATGVPLERVEVRLGDTSLPKTPGSGGSWGAHSFGTAVLEGGEALKADALRLGRDDGSPLHGLSNQEIRAADGRLFAADDPTRGETYVDILRRAGVPQLSSTVEAQPDGANNRFAIHGFGAQFCEVRVDPDTCEIRVPRFLGVYGVGKLLNPKTARSQLIGGITWGLGMALMEECALDRRYGHFVNDDLAEYHVPVNADIRDLEAVTIDETEDKLSRLGGKGLGEIGIVGVAAAVANAVYHATGVRVRKLPITLANLTHEGVGA